MLVCIFHPRNLYLALVVKVDTKGYVNVFWSCSILPDCSYLFQLFNANINKTSYKKNSNLTVLCKLIAGDFYIFLRSETKGDYVAKFESLLKI